MSAVVYASIRTHRLRRARSGLSRWYIKTPSGVRAIKLQAFRGQLFLYGQLIDRSRGAPTTLILIRFEASLAEIVTNFGRPYFPA